MVLDRAYCPSAQNHHKQQPDQLDSSGSQTLMPTIPVNGQPAAAMSTERAKGVSFAMGSTTTIASPFPSSLQAAANQQFSSAAQEHNSCPSTAFPLNQEQPQVIIRHRAPPLVPPKPQIDIVRYSMANAKDDFDLDTILSELLELENQLSGDGADQMLMGITPMAQSSSSSSTQIAPSSKPFINETVATNPLHYDTNGPTVYHHRRNIHPGVDPTTKANFVTITRANTTDICASPDIDSAYGDSSSTESSGRNRNNRNSEISSAGSYGGSLNPSPTNQESPKSSGSASSSINELGHVMAKPMTDAEIKAAKIREALEKMKEAKMKKLYVKFFLEDNLEKGMLIDERWTVAEIMQKLANKLGIVLTPEHAIVEEYPELHIRRIYEDQEFLVENIEDWLADSRNKLYFVRRNDKYCFIHSPQHYLLTEKVRFEFPDENAEWTPQQKSELLQKYFDNESMVPELDGYLMLKQDGRKSWKKHYFVLRSSGLYYCPKGKMKGTKDLQCLMNVYNNQVYTCTDWRKKYKAPTNFGFAIKHPKVQVKTSKYIKYICTEDEKSFRKWITALRIVKNGCNGLEKNFRSTFDAMQKSGTTKPIHVDTQQIHQRIPVMELTSNSSNAFPTSRPQSAAAQSINSVNSSRISVLSRQTQLANGQPNTAFDQDDCGTIKRQPGVDALNNSLSTSTFNSNIYSQRSSPSPVLTPTSNSASIHSASSRQRPTIINAEIHNDNYANSSYPKTVNFANGTAGDLDSDEEEHFPPPPEMTAYTQLTPQNGSTPQAVYQNGCDVQRTPQPMSTPPSVPFRNAPQTTKPPILTPKPVLTPQKINGIRSANKAPPPPPKRSEATRLQSPLMNDQHRQQMDLFNELQYKIQVRQIDTN